MSLALAFAALVVLSAAPATAEVTCPSGSNIYLAATGPSRMVQVSSTTGATVRTVTYSGNPYTDIAFSADGSTLYAVRSDSSGSSLYVLNPTTAAVISSIPITNEEGERIGLPGEPAAYGLTPTRDGGMLLGLFGSPVIYELDVTTGVATPYTSLPAGYVSAYAFLTLSDGDVLVFAGVPPVIGTVHPTTVFRMHPDATMTMIGTVPSSSSATQSGGVVFVASDGSNGSGTLYSLGSADSLPTGESSAPLPTTVFWDPGSGGVTGAASIQDAGCGPFFEQAKTADRDAYQVGDTVTYTVTVTNTRAFSGTADLSDPVPSAVTPTDVTCTATAPGTCSGSFSGSTVTGTMNLPPGGTAVYTITARAVAAGSGTNTATITPTTEGCDASCGGGEASTPPITVEQGPVGSLSLVKTAHPDGVGSTVDLGETIGYSFLLTNTGNVTLTDPRVTDPMVGAVSCPSAPLAPGASVTCTADSPHTVTEADILAGKVVNSASADATTPAGVGPISAPPTDTVTTPTAAAASPEPDVVKPPSIVKPPNTTKPPSSNISALLAETGSNVSWGLLISGGGLLLVAGVGMLIALRVRRRRQS